MKHIISKQFAFSASHILSGLVDGHPCARLHGHNYTVTVELSAPLNAAGMVVDYNDLALFGEWLDATFDHRHLNEVLSVNPTAENLASFIASWLIPRFPLSAVVVSETPKTTARVEM